MAAANESPDPQLTDPVRPFQAAGPGSRSTTSQFQAQRVVTYSSLFKDPGQQSSERHRNEGRVADPVLARLLLEQWHDQRAAMRDDLEPSRFADEITAIDAELGRLGPLDTPDLTVCRRIAYLLRRLRADERAAAANRIELLQQDRRRSEQQVQALRLQACVGEDERAHLLAVLQQRWRASGREAEAPSALLELLSAVLDTPSPDNLDFVAGIAAALDDRDDARSVSLSASERACLEKLRRMAAEHREYRQLLQQIGLLAGTNRSR